jgi:hypothetical protein
MARTLAQRREAEAREAEESAQEIAQEAAAVALRKKVVEDEEAVRQLKHKLKRQQQGGEEKAAVKDRQEVYQANGRTLRQTPERSKERKYSQYARTVRNVAGHQSEEGRMTTKPGFAESFDARTDGLQRENAARHVGLLTREVTHTLRSASKSFTPNVQNQPHNSVPEEQTSGREAGNSTPSFATKTPVPHSAGLSITDKLRTEFVKEYQRKQEVGLYAAVMAGTFPDDDFAANELVTLHQLFGREKGHDPDVRARGLEILEHAYTVEVRTAKQSGKKVARVLRQAILDMDAMLKAAGATWAHVKNISSIPLAKQGPDVAEIDKRSQMPITSPLNVIDHAGLDTPVHAAKPASIQASQPVPTLRRSGRPKRPVAYVVGEEFVDTDVSPVRIVEASHAVPQIVSPIVSPPIPRLATSPIDDRTWTSVTNEEARKARVVLQPGVGRGDWKQTSATPPQTCFPTPPSLTVRAYYAGHIGLTFESSRKILTRSQQAPATRPKRKRASNVRPKNATSANKTVKSKDDIPSLIAKLSVRGAHQVLDWRRRNRMKSKSADPV